MADKRKQSDQQHESDKQFLDRTGVSQQIKDILTKLTENRPNDPISFMADYFETVGDKVNRVAKAYQQICLTHHSKEAFNTNVQLAYDLLSQHKVNKHLRGLNGAIFMDLLGLLCKENPPAVNERLFKKIKCRDSEVIVFDVFKSSVFTCLVLRDFLRQASDLYYCLDTCNSGKLEKPLCEAISGQLLNAVSEEDGTTAGVLQASRMLGPSNLHGALSRALLQTSHGKKTSTCEEFQVQMAESFLTKVKPLK